jgi:malate/lactate dehydrogenase
MSFSDRNTGKPWTAKDNSQLKNLAAQNTPTRVIGFKMGRTESAVYSQASAQGVSLSPTNQRPYNRKSS